MTAQSFRNKNKPVSTIRSRSRHVTKSAKVKPTRKSIRKKASSHKKASKLIYSIVSVVVALAILGGYFFINKLNKQFVGAQSVGLQSATVLDPRYFTVVYAVLDDYSSESPEIESLTFKIFDRERVKVQSYTIKSDYMFDLGTKYGQVTASKLFALGLLQAESEDTLVDTAAQFVNDAVFELFALKVDRYVFVDDTKSYVWDSIFDRGSSMAFFSDLVLHSFDNGFTELDGVHTNMLLEEIYQSATFVSGLPEDRNLVTNIEQADLSVLDDSFREMTLDSDFAKDAQNIAVLNASGQAGLASFGSRVIKNLGGRVVGVDNAETTYGESFIISNDAEGLSTTVLLNVFGISKVLTKQQAIEYVNSSDLYRADIIVVLAK